MKPYLWGKVWGLLWVTAYPHFAFFTVMSVYYVLFITTQLRLDSMPFNFVELLRGVMIILHNTQTTFTCDQYAHHVVMDAFFKCN